ncbi:MAG: hypothetical protein CMP39_07650 [Rickettsiales bacterium]|nr:hypothetical protein [Rickettsiales bacterium]|tara:strand:+ start:10665 stop:10922 length:258 start_codon:yes stop_codon:yes gene_type:complete
MSEFSKKKITQSTYRGSVKKAGTDDNRFLDTSFDPLTVKEDKKFLFKQKVENELIAVLGKLIPEDAIPKVMNGSIMKKIFKKLGM